MAQITENVFSSPNPKIHGNMPLFKIAAPYRAHIQFVMAKMSCLTIHVQYCSVHYGDWPRFAVVSLSRMLCRCKV